MLDLVTIGHSTVDCFLKISEAEVTTSEDGDSRLCLDFADKTPAEELSRAVGGNAPNAAVGCARLGLKVAIVSWLGKDMEAELVLRALKEAGVELFWVSLVEGEKTDESVIINFQGERTILAYHFPRKYFLPAELPRTKWVYLTSAGEGFCDLHQEVLEYVSRVGAKLAYNPGMHELAAGAVENGPVLEKSAILLLNSEEAGEVAGEGFVKFDEARRAEQIGELAATLRELGPKVVVITDGANGAYAFDGEDFAHAPAVSTELTEMTGAGDSFSAAFLAAYAKGKALEECLRWGNANAASVISQVGSQAGLLTEEGIKEKLSG